MNVKNMERLTLLTHQLAYKNIELIRAFKDHRPLIEIKALKEDLSSIFSEITTLRPYIT
jgi:hypothetical protein